MTGQFTILAIQESTTENADEVIWRDVLKRKGMREFGEGLRGQLSTSDATAHFIEFSKYLTPNDNAAVFIAADDGCISDGSNVQWYGDNFYLYKSLTSFLVPTTKIIF